jgi:hypothetical protein
MLLSTQASALGHSQGQGSLTPGPGEVEQRCRGGASRARDSDPTPHGNPTHRRRRDDSGSQQTRYRVGIAQHSKWSLGSVRPRVHSARLDLSEGGHGARDRVPWQGEWVSRHQLPRTLDPGPEGRSTTVGTIGKIATLAGAGDES